MYSRLPELHSSRDRKMTLKAVGTVVRAAAIFLFWGGCLIPFSFALVERVLRQQPERYQQHTVDWFMKDPDAFFHPAIL